MNSHWFRTFGMAVVGSVVLAVTAAATEPLFLGYGNSPQWSPSGELIGAWRGDTLVVFDVAAKEEIRAIPARQPKFFYWLNEDSIALSYQGKTEAAKPRDRMTTLTLALLDMSGVYTVLKNDTLEDVRNGFTHWRRLPNGKVGVFRREAGQSKGFYQLGRSGLVETDPDTSARTACWQKAPTWVTSFFPAPNCSRALAYNTDDEVIVLDESLNVVQDLGKGLVHIDRVKYEMIDRPKWSSDGSYIAYTKYTEDGHHLFATRIVLTSMEDYSTFSVAQVGENGYLSCVWSPFGAKLALTEQGRISIWQPEH